MNYKDQLNRSLKFATTPKRIISLVPSQTELLVDLGLESFIVGITKFCVHPDNLRKKKKVVGGTKTVHFDKIRAANPDIVLCNKEENTQAMISELENIAPVHISDIDNLDHALELISMYGDLFSVVEKAEVIKTTIKKEYEAFVQFIAGFPRLTVAYFIWKNPWMVAASDTFINSMLIINAFKNYFGNLRRYPEIEIEDLKDVDLILLSSEPYPFKEKDILDFKKLVPNTKIKIVDGEFFSWYGSRLAHAFTYFKALHQNLER
ncbi:MAG: helical backbone metal receptor [Psychroserpens sp.]|uniref:ABC transporter substrate-binding protein n=1 Tax=Psychroserpens sp. TaxID=2020870 RepID=UPI003C72B72B